MSNEKVKNNLSLQEIVKKRYIENDPTLCFDTTPIYKVIILTIVTGGFYQIILFYNWWKKLKIDFGYKVSPFWRGLFSGISVFWLFPVFEKYFKCYNISTFHAGTYATLFFMCCWASNQLTFRNSNESMLIEVLSWLFLLGAVAVSSNAQTKINMINERYYPYAKNNGWKLSNTIWTIICSIVLILSIIPQPNNTQENNVQKTNIQNEQITNSQPIYNKQENGNEMQTQNVQNEQNISTNSSYEKKYNDEKQQMFQHHMRMAAKKITNELELSDKKCGLSSSALAQCFARNVGGIGNASVSGSVMTFMNDNWEFIGDGICNKSGNCKIEIISHNDTNIKATIPIYVNENRYISVE